MILRRLNLPYEANRSALLPKATSLTSCLSPANALAWPLAHEEGMLPVGVPLGV
jgi:hypothetical protein